MSQLGIQRRENHDVQDTEEKGYWNSQLRSDVFGVADWKANRLAKSYLRLFCAEHESYLRIAPSDSVTTFTDDEFIFAVQHRLHRIPCFPEFSCVDDKKQPIANLTPTQFSDHFSTCSTCSTEQFYRRHEAVLHAIHHCCKHHGYDSVLVKSGSSDNARPGCIKGGPDAIVHANGSVFAIDVSITRDAGNSFRKKGRDQLQYQFITKTKTYEKYAEKHPSQTIFPFVMNVYGNFHPSTIDLLTTLSKKMRTDTLFRRDVIRHTQCCLLKALLNSYSRLKAKKIVTEQLFATRKDTARSASQQPTSPQPPTHQQSKD
jgi:hypothetical protein